MKKSIVFRSVMASFLLVSAGWVWAQDWPQWRGPNRDGKAAGFKAPATWPKELMLKWKVAVGNGVSTPAIVGDKIYAFGRQGDEEVTTCLDAATGNEIWKDKYKAVAVTGSPGPHPGTRGSPAVAEGKVCTLGVGNVVSCLDAASGKVLWRKDTKVYPKFWASCSPLVADGKCIVFIGKEGQGSLVAYDLASGDVKWEWSGEGAPYGSPILMTVDGVKQVVTSTMPTDILPGLAAVSLADGKLLWQAPINGKYGDSMATPIIDGQIVYFAGEKNGITAFKIEKKGDEFAATQLWTSKQFPHRFDTPVLKSGSLFGMDIRGNVFCVNAQSGETSWTSMTNLSEPGGIVDAGSVMLAIGSSTGMVVFKADPKEYVELAKYKVGDAKTYSYPVPSGNRILIKEEPNMLALWTVE